MKAPHEMTAFSRLASCLSVGTVCGVACLAGCATTGDCHPVYSPDEYTEAARYSLNHAFELQANNGQVLDQTIWNYHFYEDSEELRPAGRAFLDRMANYYPLRCSGLFLQSAHDITLKPYNVESYFVRRQELNALRVKSVTEYLQLAAPGNSLALQIHDKPPVGLPSDESGRAYIFMARKAPQGLLPPDVTTSKFSFGGSSSGGDFGGGFGGGGFGGFGGDAGSFGGAGVLPQALSGASSPDSGAPDFSSDTPTSSGGGDFSAPSGS